MVPLSPLLPAGWHQGLFMTSHPCFVPPPSLFFPNMSFSQEPPTQALFWGLLLNIVPTGKLWGKSLKLDPSWAEGNVLVEWENSGCCRSTTVVSSLPALGRDVIGRGGWTGQHIEHSRDGVAGGCNERDWELPAMSCQIEMMSSGQGITNLRWCGTQASQWC